MDPSSPLHTVTTYGRNGGSARIRVFQWLEEAGVPGVVHDYLGSANVRPRTIVRHPLQTLKAEAQQSRVARLSVDRLLLQREASPFSRGGLERQLLESAEFGIYDLDDAIQWDNRKGPIGMLTNRYQKAIACLSSADRVIVGNDVLAEFAASFSDDVVVIPSCVRPNSYTVKSDFELHDPPLIGWIGTYSGEQYLRGIGAALLQFNRRTGARLQVIGQRGTSLGAIESVVDRYTWTDGLGEQLLSTWDVGIMPIADRQYERGKCGYKLLQYGAAGLPSVASPVGVNEAICCDLGFSSATSDEEWVDALTALVEASAASRERIGESARSGVSRLYSYEAWKDRWVAAIGGSPIPG
jgi:glycosyltransferase involved in cell wall biosynthesis